MTRREMLTRMLGTAVAAAIAPLIDLTDTTPAFWNQPALQKVMPWRITFPDGVSWSFDAEVIAEHVIDDEVQLTVRPRGEMKTEVEPTPVDHRASDHIQGMVSAHGTVIRREGKPVMELTEIDLPALERADHDGMHLGTLRRGNITFTVKPL